ncbi:MAG: AMP-binding enzyme, partial [Rhodobacteraceae bacterium HLUCCA24]
MLTPAASHEALVRDFRWDLPMRLNMARQVLDTWAEGAPDRVAVLDLSHERDEVSYGRLREMADGLAAEFAARGIAPGDRLGVLRSQDAWTLAAHLAAWKLGAISIPLFKLFGRDALVTRLSDAEAKLVVADRDPPEALRAWQGAVLIPEDARLGTAPVEAADTGPEDPAIIIFTSGTTGSPKGALHGHRVLTGHLPGVEISHDFLGQAGDVIWTPADWAWIGGLFDVAMPGLALGVPVVAARRSKFTPEDTVNIIR